MKPDARRYLAFRFFGTFQWPPVKRQYDSTADENDSTVRATGVVDIVYAENDDKTKLLAFLRWAPKEDFQGKTSWTPFPEDLSKVDRIQTLDDSKLSALFADYTKAVLLRLDPPRQSKRDVLTWDRRLLFRGGLILDQYKINDENDATKNDLPPIDRRLLLSRKFAKGGSRYYSDLIVGQPDKKDKNPAYRFDLALPTITPQFTTGNAETDAFPFSAIYTPKVAKQDLKHDLISIDTLVVGRGNLSTVIGNVPNDSLLGRFGFSRGPSSGCVETSNRLWTINGPLVAERVLKPIGFSTAGTLSIPSALGANRFSIRFEQKGGPKTRIFHRLSVAAGGSGTWKDGDVARISGRLHFRVPSLLSQWLDVGADAVPIEIEHGYQIADDEIWSVVSGGRPGEHVMTARLGLTGTFTSTWSEPAADTRDAADLLQNAIRGMRLAILGLDGNQSTAPDSTLADFDIPQQSALFALTAEFNPRRSKNGNLDWKIEPGIKPDYRLTMWHDTLRTDGDPLYQLSAGAWLPLLTGRRGGAGQPDFYVSISDDVKHAGDRKCQFRLLPKAVGNPQPINGILGGMSVQNISATVSEDRGSDDQSHLWFSPREPSSVRIPVGTNFNSFQLPDIFLRLRLDLSRAAPVALAAPWGDRVNGARPLLITSPRDGADKSRFLLDCRETISGNDDRWLQADLIDQTANTIDADEYVVLSQEPFGLVRFRSQALEARGSQDNAIVASYDSDTRQWQLKRTSPSYHYEFPPQASGESMDKPKRLEIHDPEPPINGVLRPALNDLQRRAVEFRLTPSAEIWIRPNDEERGYILPQWETKEIFRQNGALGVGVGLDALRAEFLYGLSVGIKPGDELGPSRRARIAEMEALVGRLPRRETIARLDDAISQRWEVLQETLSRRPERLEIWANDPESDVAFAPARFQRGAQFSLRSTALHRPPIIDGEIANEPETGKLRFDNQHGLSGGALWPLESKNFFNALVANPASTRGSIERVALSPIGGDADQKGEFLENRLAIISETRNGFVQRHKIEIVGRIAVYWHRAKHVVVYERTVNPTAQFTPDGGINTRTRRPVLRKVSEYIELIEPVRNYPDFPAEFESSGFLRSVRFNQKIINVDSEWSEDTGTFGWKIPLWNRHSAAERPQVYPRPDIGFVTNAEGEGDNPTTSQECLDPDNLYFFADATVGAGDNTDNWSSRAGIDYSLLPFPSDDVQRQSTIEVEEDGRAPSARRIPRGHRRFTWRLGPVSARTMVNAGRSDKPLYAGLQSITFMRPRPPQDPDALENISDNLRASSLLLRAKKAAELDHWRKPGGAPTELQELDQALVGFLNAVDTGGDITGGANVLVTELVKTKDDLTDDSRLAGCIAQAKTYWDTVSTLKPEDVVSRCDKLAVDFVGSLRRKQLLVLEEIRSWEAYDLLQYVAVGTTVDSLVTAISDKIMQVLKPVLTEAVRDVAGAGNGVAAARQIARDLESEIENVLERAKRELNTIRTTYDFNKPWSAQRLAEFQQRVQNVQQGIVGDLESAIFEIQHRLGVELDQVAQQIASDATFAASQIQSSITAKLNGVETSARAYLQSLKRVIQRAKMHELAAQAKAKLDQAITRTWGLSVFQ